MATTFIGIQATVGPVSNGPAVTPPQAGFLLGGGKQVQGAYVPPNQNQIDWQVMSQQSLTNGTGSELLITKGNYDFTQDTSELNRLFDVAITNGRKILAAPGCNFRSKDHSFWSAGNNGPVQFEAQHCNFFQVAPSTVGQAKGRAVDLSGVSSAVFRHCYVEGAGPKFGVLSNAYVRIENNKFVDIDGRRVGYNQNRLQWQGFQLVGANPADRPTNVDFQARWNDHYNHPDRSRSEDNVNLYWIDFKAGSIMEYGRFNGAYNNAYDDPRRLYNADGSGYSGTLAISEGSKNIKFYRLFGVRAANAGFSLFDSENCTLEECWYVSGGRHREGIYTNGLIIDANNGLVMTGGGGNLITNCKSANMRFDKAYNEGKPESEWRLTGRNDGPDNGTTSAGVTQGNLRLRGPRTYSTLPTGNVHIPTEDDENEVLQAWEAARVAASQVVGPSQ